MYNFLVALGLYVSLFISNFGLLILSAISFWYGDNSASLLLLVGQILIWVLLYADI